MDIASEISIALAGDWLPEIYRDRVRSQRTRQIQIVVPQGENHAEIQYTLLGIELKVGKRRFACPDLATARYMRVFARIGVCDFAVPYDITKISTAADALETSWQQALLIFAEKTADKPSRSISLSRSKLVKSIRTQLQNIGSGDPMPQFNRQTKQRLI